MLLRKLVVVGLVGIMTCAASSAYAQQVAPSAPVAAFDGANFVDPNASNEESRLRLDIRPQTTQRFSYERPTRERNERSDRDYEVALIASGGGGFDVSVAQRGGVGFNASGDLDRQSRASELRLGRGLRAARQDTTSQTPTWYFFAASEDEALIWQPGTRNAFGGSSRGFAVQDRVEIGDMQAGITYEANGFQASLAYVEREISVRTGARSFSSDERFAGFTFTMRR